MSSATSRLLAAALCAALGAGLALPAHAGEPNKRGKYAIIHWIDETGAAREVTGGEIRYGYYIRSYYNVPRDGKLYEDRLQLDKGLTLGRKTWVKFSSIDTIEFSWAAEGSEAPTQLALRIIDPKGKVTTGTGNEIPGANHPTSPFIQYLVGGVEQRLEIRPLASAAQRQGKPVIQKMVFTLHH